jgi:hypothetical protein
VTTRPPTDPFAARGLFLFEGQPSGFPSTRLLE